MSVAAVRAVALRNARPGVAIASALVSRLALFAQVVLAARLLAPTEFGVFAVLLTVFGLLTAVISGGDMWLNRFNWRSEAGARRAPRVWRPYLALSAISSVVVAGAGQLAGFLPEPVAGFAAPIAAMATAAAVAGFTEALLATTRASGWVGTFFTLRDVIAPLAILALMLAATDPDAADLFAIYAQVYAVVGGTVAALIALNAGTLLPPADLRVRLWRRFVTHSLGIAYGNLGSRLVTYADVFVLSALINIAEVGEYRVAAQIAVGFMVVQHFLFLGLPWQLRRIGRSHLPGPGQVRVLSQQRLLLVLAGVAAVVLVGGAEPILALFGPRFTTMADALRLLIVVRLAALLWGPLHEVLVSAGRAIDDAHANLIGLAAWLAGFWAAETALAPIAAAIIANACAVAAGQGARHLRLRARGLSPTLGHPGGVGVPMGLCLASAVVTPLVL